MSEGLRGVEVMMEVVLREGMRIKQSPHPKTNWISIGTAGDPHIVTISIESPDAADELAEALKGVADGMREQGGAG